MCPKSLSTPIFFHDVLQCYDFIRKGCGSFLDEATLSQLLATRITSFPAQDMSYVTWQAVWSVIKQVGDLPTNFDWTWRQPHKM